MGIAGGYGAYRPGYRLLIDVRGGEEWLRIRSAGRTILRSESENFKMVSGRNLFKRRWLRGPRPVALKSATPRTAKGCSSELDLRATAEGGQGETLASERQDGPKFPLRFYTGNAQPPRQRFVRQRTARPPILRLIPLVVCTHAVPKDLHAVRQRCEPTGQLGVIDVDVDRVGERRQAYLRHAGQTKQEVREVEAGASDPASVSKNTRPEIGLGGGGSAGMTGGRLTRAGRLACRLGRPQSAHHQRAVRTISSVFLRNRRLGTFAIVLNEIQGVRRWSAKRGTPG